MRSPNQERTFEVAEEKETVTVPIKKTAIAEIAAPLPPLTEQQRKDLETVHPNLKAQIERMMRKKNREEQQRPTTTALPTPAYKLQPHEEEFLKKAKSQKEREEIWIAIRADQRLRQRREQEKQLQQTTQTNQRQPIPTRARGKKKRRAPLTILQTIRYKAGARYDLIAAERIVAHICRRQGNRKNQQRRGCFESIPNMAKACRIRINRFRKLLDWLGCVCR